MTQSYDYTKTLKDSYTTSQGTTDYSAIDVLALRFTSRSKKLKTWLTETFDLKLPIIMAPMFLVSIKEMLVAAAEAGIMGCIPSLNYRTPELFEAGLKEIKESLKEGQHFGVNLIVNKSNIHLEKHMEILECQSSFIYHHISWLT